MTVDRFDIIGRWMGRDPQPFDIGDHVVTLQSDGSIGLPGVIDALGYADNYPFRVAFNDGTVQKFTAWELVKMPHSSTTV